MRRSINNWWNNLGGFWKFIFSICILTMPWTWIFVLMIVFHFDGRADDTQELIQSNQAYLDIRLNEIENKIVDKIDSHFDQISIQYENDYRYRRLESRCDNPYSNQIDKFI